MQEFTKHIVGHTSINQNDSRFQFVEHCPQALPEVMAIFAALDAAIGANRDNAMLFNSREREFFRKFAGGLASKE